ncbi:MAG TPA: phage holin family protein [Candidatus Moranbacteria bacterium]|nr:phage holin family protein [Candidatus Moranbacteria bacterium]
MSFLGRIFVHILANSAAILLANRLIPGLVFFGSWWDLAVAGMVLGIINSLIRPVIKLLSFPLVFLTLGLFSIIINIALLFVVDSLLSTIQIDGFWSAFWAVIIISITNNIILRIFNKPSESEK